MDKVDSGGKRTGMFQGRVASIVTVTLSLMAGAGIWEWIGRLSSRAFFAPFSSTMLELFHMASTGSLWAALGSSLRLFTLGLVLAALLGIPLGLLFARVRILRVAMEDYVMALYVTPMVALIPFIMSVMGFGLVAKVFVVMLFAFFPFLYNTVEGAKSIDPNLLEVARSFRASERSLWLELLIPYTLPYIMTGLRQAIGRALVGMVAAEFFLSASGLGGFILIKSRNFELSSVLAAIFVIALLGLGLMQLGTRLEKRFSAWKTSN